MKVREYITTSGWVDGSGESYSTVFDTNIINVIDEDIKAETIDWSWWDTSDEIPDGEDIHIIVQWFPADTEDIDNAEPLAKWDKWVTELQEEQNDR